ncbi:MAG: hypothetical protein QOG62_1105, partial [Thermoleophilaceae bacterium]|nr:hypothetical protein [Thermoleophilaceae bacterium]
FCEDGKFTDVFHQEGKGEGYLVKRFDCKDGTLEIRFTPQGNEKAQRGPWTIEGGSGAYDGFAGEGEMSVTFADRDNGEETFRGTVTR